MAVSGAWTYTESGGNATITDYDTGIGGFAPTIPTTLDTFPVIAIADGAMESKSLTSVTIGHSINLDGDAIANNGTLTVTINANVTTTNTYQSQCPFRNCTIGNNLTLGSSVTTIPRYLFGYSGLTSIDLTYITTIGDTAVTNNSVSSITISNVTELGDECFGYNGAIAVTLNANATTATAGFSTPPFKGCTIGAGLTIGASVTIIPNFIFASCGLTSVTLPAGLTTIGRYAFNSNSLTALSLPSSVTTIDDYAFQSNSITSLTLDHAMTLHDECFRNNVGMSVTLSANVTTNILNKDYSPFEGCAIGSGLTISSGVTTIPNYLFSSSGLTSVTFPSTVTSVGDYSFYNNSLTALTIPSTLTTINDYAFSTNSIASLTLDNVVDLGDNCFSLNSGMAVTIGANVTTSKVSTYTSAPFEGCAIGSGLTISSGVTTIPNYLFAESGVTQVTFPSTVTTLGTYVLYNNDNLDTIIFEAQETVTFGANVLNGSTPSPKGTIYGYDSSVATWASGESIPTYYDFSYNVPGSSTYIANFSNSMYNSSKFSKVIEFLA